ncbi:carboxypeptidase-like regulatory domain-containing protein [Flavobacterium ponti]|uniref:Carboxypeptidase-like regulatory domain-containing protein n=1 Tax=Flavobacterium ponti TaxID=665133 RepID=A0ABV9P4J5_9FLAO
MKKIKLLTLILFTFLSIMSCSKDDNQNFEEQSGTVLGKVTTINNLKPVGGALVFVFDDKNEVQYTYTDSNGDFSLKSPVGNREIHIQTGGGSNFRTKVNVDVTHNQTIELDQSLTKLTQVASMAYVSGSFDNIEDIVMGIGYNIDLITYNDLNDYTLMSQYDIIFLNCGSRPTNSINDNAVYTNLAKYVTNGGSLYASDWDVAYLTGGNRNSTGCNMPGGFIPDSTLCTTNNGSSGIISSQITSNALGNALNFFTIDIDYDLGSWERISMYDNTFWEVLVKNPINNEALMITTNSFHDANLEDTPVGNSNNSGWITICHQTLDSNNPYITITINQNAWPAHQAHGDTLGSCSGSTNSGRIFYTTFHNHANANIGNSALILQYIILNL